MNKMSSRSKTPGGQAVPKPTPRSSKRSPVASASTGEADLQKELKECKAEILCLRAKLNPTEIEKYKIQTVTTEQMFQDALIKAERDLKAYEAGLSDSPVVRDLREKLYAIEKEMVSLKNAAKHDAEEMTILKRRCINLDAELEKLKTQHEIVTKQLAAKEEMSPVVKELREKLYAKEKELTSIKNTAKHDAEEMTILKRRCTSLENELQKLKTQHEIATKRLASKDEMRYDADSLQKELTEVKKENVSLRLQVSDFKKQSEERKKDLSEFEYGNRSLKEKLDKRAAEAESLRSTNENLNENMRKLKSQLATLQSSGTQHSSDTKAHIAKLESDLQSAVQESEELRREVQRLSVELKQTNARCKSVSEAKSKLENDLSTLQTETEKLRKDIEEQSEILHERDVEIDKLHMKLSEAGVNDKYRSVDGRISGTDQELRRLQMEFQELDAKLKAEKDAHDRTKKAKEELEMKCHGAFEKISQKEKKLAQQEANHKQLIERKDSTIKELRREKTIVDPYGNSKPDQKTFEAMHKKALEELEELKKENNDLKSRLSKVMGTQLLDGNSNIADLSDPHSPEKLVEKFSQIYDNEWTDMFECCEIEYGSTKESVNQLFNVLINVYKFCQTYTVKLTKKTFDTLHSLSNSKERFDIAQIPPIRLQKLRELTKWFAPDLTETVIKEYQANSRIVLPRKDVADSYIHRCVEVCWLMCVQTPPVALEINESPGTFDESVYRPYTKSGKTVDYIVWPPVRQQENGRLICKGIAQAQGRK